MHGEQKATATENMSEQTDDSATEEPLLYFLLVGFLFWKFGAPIKAFLEKYLTAISIGFVVLLIGGFVLAGQLSGGGAATSEKCAGATMESIMADKPV